MTAQLHLAVDAFTLELFLERSQRLVDIVVANDDLHKVPSLSNSCARRADKGAPPRGHDTKEIGSSRDSSRAVAGPIPAGRGRFKPERAEKRPSARAAAALEPA